MELPLQRSGVERTFQAGESKCAKALRQKRVLMCLRKKNVTGI